MGRDSHFIANNNITIIEKKNNYDDDDDDDRRNIQNVKLNESAESMSERDMRELDEKYTTYACWLACLLACFT